MLTCSTIQKRVIRGHYDLSTPFYRLLWGPHIHHGLWYADESPRTAQLQLTERLADLAGVCPGKLLLDIGCGMGGSSIHLAKARDCHATGVTISPLQRRWAALSARWHHVAQKTRFLTADAEAVELPGEAYDIVWSVECTEHLFNKPEFFQRAAAWLKPGGTLAVCAWLAGEELDRRQVHLVHDVCVGFFCPSLGTMEDYQQWIRAAELEVCFTEDWTLRVAKTWEICRRRVLRSKVHWLAPAINRDSVVFLDRFETILAAYRNGAMKYGCFIARKPEAVEG